jgi:methylmalonyl-CoA decarboxylase subunit alpha
MIFEQKKPTGIDRWIDKSSFIPFQPENKVALVMGRATLGGYPVWIMGNVEVESSPRSIVTKHADFLDYITNDPLPLVILMDGSSDKERKKGRTPIPEDSVWLQNSNRGVGYSYFKHARLRTVLPQIAVVLSDIGASQTFPINLCHFSILLKNSHISIGRADVVKNFTGKEVDIEELSDSYMHSTISGVNDLLVEDEDEARNMVIKLLKYLPSGVNHPLPVSKANSPDSAEPIDQIVPSNVKQVFDMNRLLLCIADKNSLFPVKKLFAQEVITSLSLFEGRPVGIIANNPSVKGGMLFPKTCQKMIRFIDVCDQFRIPILFLADNPGYMIGVETEQAGAIRYGADLMIRIATSETPKMCVVVRRAYTAGLFAMAGAGFKTDHYYAMPTASITIFGKDVLEKLIQMKDHTEKSAMIIDEIKEASQNPQFLVDKGYIEKILEWNQLRDAVISFAKEVDI